MNKLSKDKRDKIILVAMLTVAIVAGIWFLLLSSQLRTHADARKARETARAQVSNGQATLKAAPALEKSFEELSAKLKKCEAEMAAPTDMYSWFIQSINQFRSGYAVDIPQFSRERPSEVGMFPKFPYPAAVFTVRGVAYYHDFGKFLADFENTHPYMRVQAVELEPGADVTGPSREKLMFRMELLTLVRPINP